MRRCFASDLQEVKMDRKLSLTDNERNLLLLFYQKRFKWSKNSSLSQSPLISPNGSILCQVTDCLSSDTLLGLIPSADPLGSCLPPTCVWNQNRFSLPRIELSREQLKNSWRSICELFFSRSPPPLQVMTLTFSTDSSGGGGSGNEMQRLFLSPRRNRISSLSLQN